MVSTQLLKGGNIQTSPYHQYCIYSKAEIKLVYRKEIFRQVTVSIEKNLL